jgi:4-hydroxy-tetrahydrodipicolinate reductase
MKIGLIGYGKMGKAIAKIAQNKGHQIIWIISKDNQSNLDIPMLHQADVAIEFTNPEAVLKNLRMCIDAKIPVVSGTTGWQNQYEEIKNHCNERESTMLWASNFSVGVNILFAVNEYLTKMMAKQTQYNVGIIETHHIHKLDAPSGTAISLADGIINNHPLKEIWVSHKAPKPSEILIEDIRKGETPGTHTITWESENDQISIEHKAHNRAEFASGAVMAAEWILDKKGVFTMSNVLGI